MTLNKNKMKRKSISDHFIQITNYTKSYKTKIPKPMQIFLDVTKAYDKV